jgi:hypothetical protein
VETLKLLTCNKLNATLNGGSSAPLYSPGLKVCRECWKTNIFVITGPFGCRMYVRGAVTAITVPVLIFSWIWGEFSRRKKGTFFVCFSSKWHEINCV